MKTTLNSVKKLTGMARIPFVSVLAFILFTACDNDDTVESSGRIVSEERTVEAFSALSVSNAFDVTVTQSDVQSVIVTVSDNILPRVVTEVMNGTLNVRLSGSNNIREQHLVEIMVPELERIEFNDATSGVIVGGFESPSLVIDLSGSSTLDLEGLMTGNLDIRLFDASGLFLTGNADDVKAELRNASEVRAFGLSAPTVDVGLFDASDMKITCTEVLSGSVSGASDLRYQGNPEVQVTTSSAGEVINSN